MNNGNLLIVIGLLMILFGVVGLACNVAHQDMISDVKSGKVTLICDIKDKGHIEIDPEMVVDRIDGVWIFENGWAKNCATIEKGDY